MHCLKCLHWIVNISVHHTQHSVHIKDRVAQLVRFVFQIAVVKIVAVVFRIEAMRKKIKK